MKLKATLYTSLALCSLSLASCSDKDVIDNGQPLPAGTEIQFGTTLDSNLDSRTYYDPTDVANPSATAWKIYWNYEANDLDKIFIYSPEAAAGCNQATYTVDPEGEDKYQATKVTKDGAAGIQTGDGDGNYNFYSLYPASAVTGTATNGVINATFKGIQTATYNGGTNPGAVSQTITLDADMENCLMVAKNSVPATGLSKGVGLNFVPYASVLNIEINGPKDANFTNNEVTITSVVVSSTQQLSGDFSVDFNGASDPVFKGAANPTDEDKSIRISTLVGGKGITLKSGGKLNVRAFILPNTDINDLKVTVYSSVSQTWTRTLATGNFKPAQIHSCKLPALTSEAVKLDYSIWLSQLDPNIYLSEISMPGSALAFNYLMVDKEATASDRDEVQSKTQSVGFREQMAAGSRVLQSHITYNTDDDPAIYIANSAGNIVQYNGSNLKLIDVVNALVSEMSVNHGSEFCVLSLSDYLTKGKSLSTLLTKLKAVLATDEYNGKVVTALTPETTLGDVRDRIIVKWSLNTSDNTTWNNLDGANLLMNTWGVASGSSVWYSPLTFGTIPTDNGGTSSSSSVSTWNMAFIYSEQANPVGKNTLATQPEYVATASISSVLKAYVAAYTSDAHKVFGMTYLGGTGRSVRGVGSTTTISPTDVTLHFISNWNTAITDSSVKDKPYGWVLFNMVGSGNATINAAVSKVIERNSEITLKKKTAPVNYTGSAGATNGGQLND